MDKSSASRNMLVVDDEPGMRQLLESIFKDRGFVVTCVSNGEKAIQLLQDHAFDVIITDLKMPGKDGMAVLRAARAASAESPIILVTAYASIETAVEAMRLGARDFIQKPFSMAEIELKVDKVVGELRPARPVEGRRVVPEPSEKRMVGDSKETKQLLKIIEKIAASRSSVLITGPSGTGKELVARAIHDSSPRKERPFVALNCAALAPGVLESELFGHERGAFTGAVGQRSGRFERAHTGTLFLDEVGDIDPNIQTKLLRVLQEGEFERVGGTVAIKVDVRIVAATNRDLREAIKAGTFREDFYYRLNVFSLHVQPLRKRIDDIPALVDLFLRRFSLETGKQVVGVEDGVMSFFMQYPWPGNVRELENVLERAVVLTEGPTVTLDEIPPDMLSVHAEPGSDTDAEPAAQPLSDTASLIERTDRLESEMIASALKRFRWNKTKAADHLGIKRTTLQYKIKKYGLE